LSPLRLGFRVCDRRHPFLWTKPGQSTGRWNRAGDQPVHYLASTPTVAWAEWIRHQEIHEPDDLAGVAAALWAVLIPESWGGEELQEVTLPLQAVLGTKADAQTARLNMVTQLKRQGAQGLLAPSAALHQSHNKLPCMQIILLWCQADQLPGWCCVPEGRPGPELLPLVRREGRLA
jgi:RES domain